MLRHFLATARARLLVQPCVSLLISLVLVLTGHAAYRYATLRSEKTAALEAGLRVAAREAADVLAEPLRRHDYGAAAHSARNLADRGSLDGFVVLRSDGVTVFQAGNPPAGAKDIIAFTQPIAVKDPAGDTDSLGAVVVSASRQPINRELREQIEDIAASHAGLALSLLLAWLPWLWRAHRPLGIAITALERLAAEGREVRMAPPRRGDGPSRLARLILSCRDSILRQRQTEADLRTRLAEKQALIDDAPVGILSERDGIILSCNRHLERLFGYQPGELLGSRHASLFSRQAAFLQAEARAGHAWRLNKSYGEEVLMCRKDGAVFRAARAGVPSPGSSAGLGERTWTYVEIGRAEPESPVTERDRRLAAVEEASMAKGERPAALGRPRAGQGGSPPGEASGSSSRPDQGCGVPDLMGSEGGRPQGEQVAFQLGDMMGGVGILMSIKAEAKGVELVFDIDPGLPDAYIGDPLGLAQVLSDLIGNAIKRSRRGHIVISVREGMDSATRMELVFSVRRGMVPMAAGTPPKEFSRGDQPLQSSPADAGLGLAICQRLVETMGGILWQENLSGGDSAVHFTVQLGTGAAGADPASGYADRLKAYAGRRVMVIDDDTASLRAAGALLTKLGFVPELFGSARKALAGLAAHRPSDYLFCCVDWIMPDLDGFQVARLLRAHCGRACPPLLLLTAFGHVRNVRGVDREFAGIVSKPFTLDQLYSRIDSILPTAAAGRDSRPDPTDTGLAARLKGKRILLVEHAEAGQEIMADLLRQADLKVRLAGNGVEALQAVREQVPDCILMDCLMPVMDGLEAAARLRSQGFGQLPIIGLAVNARSVQRGDCLAAGMNDVVGKPVDIPALLALLAKWTGVAPTPEAPGPGSQLLVGTAVPAAAEDVLPPLPPGLDVEGGLRRLCGKTALFLKALRMFRDSRGHEFQLELRAAVVGEDWQTSERLAHSLQGTADAIGAHGVSAAAARLETAIRAGDYGEVPLLLADVTGKLRALVDGLAHIG